MSKVLVNIWYPYAVILTDIKAANRYGSASFSAFKLHHYLAALRLYSGVVCKFCSHSIQMYVMHVTIISLQVLELNSMAYKYVLTLVVWIPYRVSLPKPSYVVYNYIHLAYIHTHTYKHTHLYAIASIYIYACVCI